MDKNTITGFILIALVLIGFSWYSQPSAEQLAEMARQDSIAAAASVTRKEAQEKAVVTPTNETMQTTDSSALFFDQRNGQGEELTLSNGLLELTLSTRGGGIRQARLMNYRNQEGNPVEMLLENFSWLSFSLSGKEDNISTPEYVFLPIDKSQTDATMRLGTEERHMDIRYELLPESYLVNITVATKGFSPLLQPSSNKLFINWHSMAAQQEKGFDFEQRYSSLTYREKDGDTDDLSETKSTMKQPDEPLEWVAFKNQFFSCVLLTPDAFTEATLSSAPQEKNTISGDGVKCLKEYDAALTVPFDPSGMVPTRLQMYVGPNDFHILKAHNKQALTSDNPELEDLVYLGWPLFRWVNRWIIMPLFYWLSSLGLSMGVVLLLLTIIVKILVYPTTKKSYLSSAKMRVLKPEIDKISQKYTEQEDAMKKQQEMMQLYSQYGVSPMGGCLPMLIQMPIWIALFNFVPNCIQLRGERFLWADDLSSYDELIRWNTDLWLIGDHLSIFCLLFSITNIINTWISMRQQQNQLAGEQAQQMKMMQYMMYLMPLMFFFMFNNYSSGLCYYYFLSGLTSILIMWFLRKTTDDAKLLAKLNAYRDQHKNDPKKMSGMAARLEALQKMAEEQQKRNRK